MAKFKRIFRRTSEAMEKSPYNENKETKQNMIKERSWAVFTIRQQIRRKKENKKISLLMAVMVLISKVAVPSCAEESHLHMLTETPVIVEASDGQAALEARCKPIIEVDGLQFKELNGNGQLDIYKDWRQDVDARVVNLISLMTMDERIATLMNNTTGGTFTSLLRAR